MSQTIIKSESSNKAAIKGDESEFSSDQAIVTHNIPGRAGNTHNDSTAQNNNTYSIPWNEKIVNGYPDGAKYPNWNENLGRAADPNYNHDIVTMPNGPALHFLYKNSMPAEKLENWKKLQPKTVELMNYFSENIGTYPYKQYSVIQGGDGGMNTECVHLLLEKEILKDYLELLRMNWHIAGFSLFLLLTKPNIPGWTKDLHNILVI